MDYYWRGWHRDPTKQVWHGSVNAKYGKVDEIIRIDEAMRVANMYHVTVTKDPMYCKHGHRYVETGDYKLVCHDGFDTDPIFIGRTVKEKYEPMQPARLAELLEPLNEHWPIEGTLMVKEGAITIVQLAIDEYHVGGFEEEKHYDYLTVAIDYTQGGVFWLRTGIRAVCFNTYSMSLQELNTLRIPNSSKADDTLNFLAQVQTLTVESQKLHTMRLNSLFERKVNIEEAATIVEAAFPDPNKSSRMKIAELEAAQEVGGQLAVDFFRMVDEDAKRYEWAESRVGKERAAVGNELVRFNDNHPYASDTAYAWFQSITNVINHSPLYTGSQDKRAVSYILGNKKKVQEDAFQAALDLVGLADPKPKRGRKAKQ